MKTHVLILNFNGAQLLEKYLPSFVEALKRSRHPCRLSVVDNVSTDESREVVGRWRGSVGWIPAEENRILFSYNEVAEALDDEILILMNNDVEADPGFIDPLVDPFERDAGLFLTSPGFYSADRSTLEGARAAGGVRWGLFWSKSVPPPGRPNGGAVTTLTSGMGAVDRKKFLALGGYDALYAPGTLEDVDLCFRAWRKGWRSLYVPQSRVYHVGQVSFKKRFGPLGLRVINSRNLYLFMWKNISDPGYWAEHFFFLFPRVLWSLVRGRPELAVGLWRALGRLPEAVAKRSKEPRVLGDRRIFDFFRERA